MTIITCPDTTDQHIPHREEINRSETDEHDLITDLICL